jgi:hypothetical protein
MEATLAVEDRPLQLTSYSSGRPTLVASTMNAMPE